MNNNRSYTVDAIQKMDQILTFVQQKKETTFSEVCTELNFAKSSTYRLLSCLMNLGYLRQNSNGKIELGIRLFELGYQMSKNIDLIDIAHPHLETLSLKTGYMVHLGVLKQNGEGVFLDRIDCREYTLTDTAIGGRVKLHCSAVGKALLAWQEPEILNAIIEKMEFDRCTSHTITDKEQFAEEMKLTKMRGYSVDNTEHENYIIGIGVPVFDWENHVVAGISIGAFKSEFNIGTIDFFVESLKAASRAITKSIGVKKVSYMI